MAGNFPPLTNKTHIRVSAGRPPRGRALDVVVEQTAGTR